MRRALVMLVTLGLIGGCAMARYEAGYSPSAQVQAEAEAPNDPAHNTEAYSRIDDNPFFAAKEEPLSTFSIDVDTASYSNVRRFLTEGRLPPHDAVRVEELINYFPYAYPGPEDARPFAANVEVADCPWAAGHRLVRIGLKGREVPADQRPPSNLVFLVDVSGSMFEPHKLPLLKRALSMLAERLDGRDRVSLVTYAGAAGLVLPPTPGDHQREIQEALARLEAGGSTNGAAGIQQAYQVARQSFIPGGTNRVILATDGDFNVGVSSEGELTRLIEGEAKSGIFLTVLGFGMGNYKDATLEKLADRGNGNYGYIDNLAEARKLLVEGLSGTLVTIAKDVKVQVEFNPARVQSYRLLGYENRLLRKQDFNDDQKDAGEIGAGHTVTALYEVVPTGAAPEAAPAVDALHYQAAPALAERARSGELLWLKLRYKEPEGEKSSLLEAPVSDSGAALTQASADFKFQAAVAAFGMLLRDSPHKGQASYALVRELGQAGRGADPQGYRAEFLRLVEQAQSLGPARGAGGD